MSGKAIALGSVLLGAVVRVSGLPVHPGYELTRVLPEEMKPQVTGLEVLPDGDLLVLTWRGSTGDAGVGTLNGKDIDKVVRRGSTGTLYRYSNLNGPGPATSRKIAEKFKDAQGLAVVDGEIYVGDIDRIVKLVDKDRDGVYEEHREIARLPSYDGWFEYAFGPVHRNGRLYMSLAVGVQRNGWPTPQFGQDRSTVVSVPVTGRAYEVVAQGLRAPDGIGLGPEDEIFVSDNQGSWRGSSAFFHIRPGRFYGYMVDPPGKFQDRPVSPPAVWTPHGEVNASPTEMSLLKGGPYRGQFIFGDITNDNLNRIFLEKVNGEYQGGVFQHSGSIGTKIHRIRTGGNGEIWVGGLAFYGSTPGRIMKLAPKADAGVFEMLAVRSRRNGMEIEFTRPVGDDAAQPARYQVRQWGYHRVPEYQSQKQEQRERKVASVLISPDRKRVYLGIDSLKTGQVVELLLKDLKSASGDSLWHPKAWYTLNAMSSSDPFLPDPVAAAPDIGGQDGESGSPAFLAAATAPRSPAGGLRVTLLSAGEYRITVMDLQGRILAVRDGVTGSQVFSGDRFRPGLHLVQVSSATRKRVKKVML